ncbi:MAG TPA: NAD(P)/FAD-dependent oxidoreductase [Candidatus Bathyarchaeia archaeon]|nr:NAD(P)/FAD-dependent oxidoreductase [Candidatus Bathyarchaeia archaeon]
MKSAHDADVLVVGAGPGGSTAATFLARGGLRVAIAEREAFPRFKVGESLIPTCMDICKRLGVHDRLMAHGFQVKYGATFHDQELGLETTFDFRPGRPWPSYTLDVHRAEFDEILLDHAVSQPNVTLHQPATVEKVVFDAEGVTARLSDAGGERELRAAFLLDASGRDAFLAARQGQRKPRPGLGKVAIFAYFRGAKRFPGRAEGNVRLYIFPEGWFWYIPLARDETSVGCVLHQRVVKARRGTLQELFDEMVTRCHKIDENLRGSERVTELYTTSNFAYSIEPIAGDRFLCVGDAVAFVDPIFSPGVFLAMQTGELAARAILRAFRANRFEARRFRPYERAVRRGTKPFERFIESYYDRAFLEVFMRPKNVLGVVPAVTGVLAGGSFGTLPKHLHLSLWFFHQVVRLTRWMNLRRGVVLESRLDW